MHRLILLSAAYQQRSDAPGDARDREQALRVDPENRLLWRMNPRRLTFEEARDTLLAASGELDRRVGGRAAELFPAGGTNVRRTLYGLVDRQFLAERAPGLRLRQPRPAHPLAERDDGPPAGPLRAQPPVPRRPGEGPGRPRSGTPTPRATVRRLYRAAYQREPTESQVARGPRLPGLGRRGARPDARPGDAGLELWVSGRSIPARAA